MSAYFEQVQQTLLELTTGCGSEACFCLSYLTGISGCFLGRLKPSPEPLSMKTSVKTAVGSSSPFAPCLVRTTCVVDSTAVMVLPRGVNDRNWQIRTMKKVAIIRTAIRNNVSRRLRGCSVASEAVRLRLPLCFDMLKLRRSRQRPIQRCCFMHPRKYNRCKHYYQRILKHMLLAIDENFVTVFKAQSARQPWFA